MNRLYSQSSYLNLVQTIKETIPNVSLSTDIIVGFCNESEEQFQETIKVVKEVGYDQAFIYEYSMREKTMAHRKMVDNVDPKVKNQRLTKLHDLYLSILRSKLPKYLGTTQLVLIDQIKNHPKLGLQYSGKQDDFRTVVIDH
jgi:tRNA-2-methylthio-N6-dimethylallyladenosine synthase